MLVWTVDFGMLNQTRDSDTNFQETVVEIDIWSVEFVRLVSPTPSQWLRPQ